MNKSPGRNRAISILGMHRSGTSTIMRSFNLLGAYLGEEKDLMKPKSYNPEGFWERRDLYYLQEELLAALKLSWDSCMPLPDRWQDASEVRPFREKLVALIRQNFSGVPLWGWKDPRSTILFDLWKDVLEELCVELSVVFAVRNPLDVARSLQQRNGFSCDKSYGIWFNYNITALRAISSTPVAFLSYDKFLANWESELRRCAQTLNIEWPQEDSDLKEKMNSFIRSDLRHSCSTMEDLKNSGAPEPVVQLYGLLLGLLDGGAALETVSIAVEGLYKEFFAYSRFYQYDAVVCRDVGNKLGAMEMQLGDYDLQLTEINRQLAERSCKVNELENSSAGVDDKIVELNQRVQELKNSWSWKVTGPLRKLYGAIKHLT